MIKRNIEKSLKVKNLLHVLLVPGSVLNENNKMPNENECKKIAKAFTKWQ